jgi:MYXO-CTERM domain-containing protein
VIEALRNEVSAQRGKAISPDAAAQMHLACDIIRPMLGVVPDPDFDISIEPKIRSLTPGGSATYAVRTRGRATSVSLRLGALPPGVVGTFDRQLLHAGETAQLTVTALPDVPAWASGPFVVGASSTASLRGASARLDITPVAAGADRQPAQSGAVQTSAEAQVATGCTSTGNSWGALISLAAIALATRRRRRRN